MNKQENDQQHQHQQEEELQRQDDQGKEREEHQEKETEGQQEKEAEQQLEQDEELEKQEQQQKQEELETPEQKQKKDEQEKQEQNHNMHFSSPSPTNSSSPPFESPQLSTISADQAYHSYAFPPPEVKPPKPSSPLQPAAVQENMASSNAQDAEVGGQNHEEGIGGGGGGGERRLRPNLSILRRVKRENMKRRALLGFRIVGFLFCLVSFSVMAADKNQGWALDSFNQYKEFRYCMSVNVLGFVYSALQGYDLSYSLATGKHVVRTQLRCFLDFSIDQIMTYLLLSASSSAAFRVEDWESNWGKDAFPTMARASVSLSFLAFVAFALSSLVSGYTLFTPNST